MLGGIVAAVAIAAAGWAVERSRLGATEQAARARLEAEVTAQFAALGRRLDAAVLAVGAEAADVRAAELGDAAATRRLFDQVQAGARAAGGTGVALTVYGSTNQPVAWTGATSEAPVTRVAGPATVFLAPSPQGLQMVRTAPIIDVGDPARHVGAVVAETPLRSPDGPASPGGSFVLSTLQAPVGVRPQFEGAADAGAGAFIVRAPDGAPLAAVDVPPGAVDAARARLRGQREAALLALAALLAVLCVGPLLDWRGVSRSPALGAAFTIAAAGLLLAARALLWIAVRRVDLATPSLTTTGSWAAVPALMLASPLDFALTSLLCVGLVGVAVSGFSLWRTARRPGLGVLPIDSAGIGALFVLTHLAAGSLAVAIIAGYEAFLHTHVSQAPVDILRFSLDPWDGMRLLVVVGLVALNAAVVGGAVLVLRLARAPWAYPDRRAVWQARAVACWLVPGVFFLAPGLASRMPFVPALIVLVAVAATAWIVERYRAGLRHSSQAARLVVSFLALVVPSVVFYPSLVEAAQLARRQLVESRYAPEVTNQRRDVQVRLREALIDIDDIENLGDLVRASEPSASGAPAADAAFLVWSQTSLASQRLTSSVELHNAAGVMVSRFALKLPDSPQNWTEASCDWEILEEVSPFFAEERRLLHAGRGICEPGTRRLTGSVIVHVMLDYGNLSFISAQNPYVELLRSGRPRPEPRLRADVEFTAYGWSRRVLYTSGQTAPPLPDAVFRQAHSARTPFWISVDRGGTPVDAYVLNDRGAIYVLGTARQTAFGHLVTLGELVSLGFALFVVLAGGTAAFSAVTARAPSSGRSLLDEVRASFYRKLFLAFVAAAVVPVLALAFVSRAYIAALIFADIESEATRTAAVASRVVEDFGSLQARGLAGLPVVDDNLVVWLSRVIAQDVNIFDGPALLASSERNLFASGLLSTRTPGDAYRAILLEGRPSFVGRDSAGGLEYVVAAAPGRAQGRGAVLTVPLTSRQQQTDAQVQELDRRVLLAALLFIMVGAAIGYYMAERIADPVNRLMRATQRIAHGDLDARVLATSSDELRRLVEAFNRMAAELQQQRRELERTNRLQAWADMARQVAHDIKNPLTPIQLNAEHLRRVHVDQGRPLGGMVDDCVANILGQVRLLRQISSEFSSFASSPEPKPVAMNLAEVVSEVVEPYRAGLAARVTIASELAAGLPLVRADRMLVGRALTNVIENALHAMPAGGSLTIAAEAVPVGFVSLTVTDTGVGMDADALAKIFEPYFSTKATGTGLGLTIAKRNTEANGGSISVTSARGRGTAVTMTLAVA